MMNKAKLSHIASSINRYCEGKEKLEKVLACSNEQAKGDHVKSVQQAEVELEQAFQGLLASTPKDLSEVISKSRLFVTEVLSDAEVTRYQALTLQCIIDDLIVLLIKSGRFRPVA